MKKGIQEGGNEIFTLQKLQVIKQKLERRKIQLEVTVTLNTVPAMMRA